MPPIETSHRRQRAILWEPSGYGRAGEIKLTDPIEIDIRWEDTQVEVVDDAGSTILTDAVAYVNQDIALNSILWIGELSELPTSPTDLKRVIRVQKIPDLKNRFIQRTLYLIKHSDALPTVS